MSTDKPQRVPAPAHLRFTENATSFEGLDLRDRFERIYKTNLWGSDESHSGTGSEIEQTARVRGHLEGVIARHGVRSMLDIPCGDFAWMRHTNLEGISYIGADIVPALVEQDQQRYGSAMRRFASLDLTADDLPAVDLVFCRDCLVHLCFEKIAAAVRNLKRSGSVWLLTTTFPQHDENHNISDGDWRLLNFERAPFHFPPAEEILNEGCTEEGGSYADKSLGLWRIALLP